MPLMSPEEFVQSLKARRPMDIWFMGQKIEDPTTFPALAASLKTITKVSELARDPRFDGILTAKSPFTGEKTNFYLCPILSQEDAIQKSRMARCLGEMFGCCSHRCTGSEAISGLFPLTYDLDQQFGTKYHSRFKKWVEDVQRKDLSCLACLTDPKGDRRKKAPEQENPDAYLRVAERNDDGIVLRGCKINQTGTIFGHEVVVVPTAAQGEDGKDYIVSCAVPADDPNLTYVLGRTPFDCRGCGSLSEEIDQGKQYADHQCAIFFKDVFVPWDRVFLCGEWQVSGTLLEYFTAVHRLTAGACKSGGLTMLLGAATLAASHIGVERFSHVRSKLTEIAMQAESLYSLSVASGVEGWRHEGSGAWIPNSLLAHTCKYMSTHLPFDACRVAREIFSGWGETAPAAADLQHPEIGPLIDKYFKPQTGFGTSEERLRAIRLIESMTRGSNWTSMALHGGGNPEAARLMAMRHVDWKKAMAIASAACGISKNDDKAVTMITERAGKVDLGPKAFKS